MTKHTNIRFDTALTALVQIADESFGREVATQGLFLRDANGTLTFILRSAVEIEARAKFDQMAKQTLGSYVQGPSATADELYDSRLENLAAGLLEPVEFSSGPGFVRILDRRIVGQDWNTPSFSFELKIPILSFFSCKGGVGRSTALAVAAAALSDIGQNVMIVDLDLEAPGIGTILLPSDGLPEYGVLDYLVEQGLSPIDSQFLEDCISPSPLTAGRGLVEVMPAVGQRGVGNPQNVLPKLGRAFIDRVGPDGETHSFMGQVQSLMKAIAERGRTSVILVDARAGLSESSAAAVVGLGGTVLMFGVDTPQTFECYRYLFAQMNRYALDPDVPQDWRFGLQMVHAKAGRGTEAYEHFRDQALNLFAEFLYDEAAPSDLIGFNFDIDDDSAPHYAWPISFDADFVEFDPHSRRDQLSREFFDRSFGLFVRNVINNVTTFQGQVT
ncbi:MAG TPA: P-loop NTPase [Aliidongia sp.]|uniref:KGGVGR-motif variant AAA ATPase n=1 Tax=Aliidongia sp. TaxID=1914230 RepID=UPI002DDCDA98|nr:P-loop NTPase [Aliidongia sp.]HEV2678714.1 P-loop NTPase [Aliidongia sp.]